jgi:hypothetical protein
MNAIKHPHKAEFHLPHPVDASKAAQSLTHFLRCESWYVVCHREHQLIIHLSSAKVDQYALSCECTQAVDKAIYHGSKTSSLSLVPLGDRAELTAKQQDEIRFLLGQLAPSL